MTSRTLRLPLAAGVALLLLAGLAVAPARASLSSVVDGVLGRYIVTLDDGVGDPAAVARRQAGALGGTVDRVFRTALKGYSTSLPQALLSRLLADPLVAGVEPDVQVKLAATQVDPPYGLDRIDQRDLPLSRSYTYGTGGSGVRAYVIDSGTRRDQPDFLNRVAPGYNVFDRSTDAFDCNGHGTHVAGILAGSTYGVAKGATVVPVKIFRCTDSTPLSAILAGVDWVTADHRPGQPAVANLSLGAGSSAALDQAVAALSDDGVAVAVAAGNEAADACAGSPARVPQVLTVAATDVSDAMAGFSSFGPCVDLFAPGVRITSADLRSNGSSTMSGTSMAAPHVAGALAREMGLSGTTAQQAQARVLAQATTGRVKGAEQTCALLILGCRPATPNRLLYTG
ncbi:MAG: S8 family peptidase [Acidimicrobiales bacterium]